MCLKIQDLLIVLVAVILVSCGGKQEQANGDHHHSEAGEDVWKEMDDFHMLMAEAFHPFKDSANLEPAKALAAELMTAASQWEATRLPQKVDNKTVRAKLLELKSEAAILVENVKSSDDNVIGEKLTSLHETFHEIQEAWYGGH